MEHLRHTVVVEMGCLGCSIADRFLGWPNCDLVEGLKGMTAYQSKFAHFYDVSGLPVIRWSKEKTEVAGLALGYVENPIAQVEESLEELSYTERTVDILHEASHSC
jgi:hypothetical protein